MQPFKIKCKTLFAGGAAYLIYLSRSLALTCGGLLALLALVALRYGSFQRDSQRAYQNELANTNQVEPAANLMACPPLFLPRFIPPQSTSIFGVTNRRRVCTQTNAKLMTRTLR